MNQVDLVLAQRTVDFLNELLEIDRPAIAALVANRVPCNRQLADHESVQVGAQHGGFHVGILGVLNGLCGTYENHCGAIVAEFEFPGTAGPPTTGSGFGSLTRFRVAREEEFLAKVDQEEDQAET